MKSILFIPSYYYLSDTLFCNIVSGFKGDESLIYLDTEDPIYLDANKRHVQKKSDVFVYKSLKIESRNKINRLLEYRKRLVKEVNNIGPAVIIFTTDHSLSFQIIEAAFPRIKKIVIQPTFLNFDGRVSGWRTCIKGILASIVLRVPIDLNKHFGLNSPRAFLILWGNISADFYKGKRGNVYILGNPNYERALKESLLPQKIEKRCLLLIDDYNYLGKSFNNNVQESLSRLVRKRADITWMVRIHPRLKGRIDFNYDGENIIDCTEDDLDMLLVKCGFTLSTYSNVAVGGILNYRPAVFYCPEKQVSFERWFPGEINYVAETFEDLENKIDLLFQDGMITSYIKWRDDYLQRLLGQNGADSSGKVLEVILERAKNGAQDEK